MRRLLLLFIILAEFSCKKEKTAQNIESKEPEFVPKCGTILATPNLDSFVYPTCYLTATVAYDDGKEVVHFQYKVPGNHDGSWFLTKYDKDSTYCTEPVSK